MARLPNPGVPRLSTPGYLPAPRRGGVTANESMTLTRLSHKFQKRCGQIRATLRFLIVMMTTFSPVVSVNAQQTRISASFDPPAITLGERSLYQLKVEGSQESFSLNMPRVSGLKIDLQPRVSRSVQWVNGRQSVSITASFTTRPERKGTFVVPSWDVTIGGNIYRVPAASLKVVAPGEEFRDALIFRLQRPQDPVYVGQTLRCNLKLYVRSDIQIQLKSMPRKEGDAFTQSELTNEFTTAQENFRNLPYKVAVWPVILTPLKAGRQILTYQADVVVSSSSSARRRRNSLFDSIFDDPFFTRNRGEERTVFSGDIVFDVQELPKAGQPSHFNGAIGKFDVSNKASPTELTAGEPITLVLEISGEGNFDRVLAPKFDAATDFKVYSPKSEFTPSDTLGLQGTKRFEYILIPKSESVTSIPSIPFSYFATETLRYVDLSTAPIALTVLPAPEATAVYLPPAASAPVAAEIAEPAPAASLLPIQLLPGSWIDDAGPLYRSRGFMAAQGIPLVVLLSVVAVRRRRLRLQRDHAFARRISAGKAVRQRLQEAREAANEGDAEGFFQAACRAIQECVGKHFEQESEALTFVEIQHFLGSRGTEEKTLATTREIFDSADAIRFGGSSEETFDLRTWIGELSSLIRTLEALS